MCELIHGSDGLAKQFTVSLLALAEPAIVVLTTEVSDLGQARASGEGRQNHGSLSSILVPTELCEV